MRVGLAVEEQPAASPRTAAATGYTHLPSLHAHRKVIESARLDSIMRLMEDEAEQQQSELSWWRRKMLSLTSWTGAEGLEGPAGRVSTRCPGAPAAWRDAVPPNTGVRRPAW